MEDNIKRLFIEAAQSYSSVGTSVVFNNPKMYKAFRAGQDNAYEILGESAQLKARIVLLEDALNMVLGIEDAAFGLRGFDAKRLKSEIKKALNQK